MSKPAPDPASTRPVAAAALRRRSHSKVAQEAPTDEELLPFIAAAATVADHAALRPWRVVALRGEARERLGDAFVRSSEVEGEDAAKLAGKPLRASLLLAVVASRKPSFKVPDWEQDATAAGVAHLLSLLLDEAGWGVMWRTGNFTRSAAVRELHGLTEREELLGWLYVGRVPEGAREGAKSSISARDFLTAL
jgi:nitroreductase